jgi:hypothetical protein
MHTDVKLTIHISVGQLILPSASLKVGLRTAITGRERYVYVTRIKYVSLSSEGHQLPCQVAVFLRNVSLSCGCLDDIRPIWAAIERGSPDGDGLLFPMIRIPQHWSQRSSDGNYAPRLADSEATTFAYFLKAACLFDQGGIDYLAEQSLQYAVGPARAKADRPPRGGELTDSGVELCIGLEVAVPSLAEILQRVSGVGDPKALPICSRCIQAFDNLFED